MTPYIGICRWYNGFCHMALVRDRGGNEMDITKDQYDQKYQEGKVEPAYMSLPVRR